VSTLYDFSQLPDDLGGGQGPIEIHAVSTASDPIEYSNDKFIGTPGHINIFDGGLGFDSITGGNLDDRLSGGAESDKIDGGRGDDILRGGSRGRTSLLGGPGRDNPEGRRRDRQADRRPRQRRRKRSSDPPGHARRSTPRRSWRIESVSWPDRGAAL